MDRRFTKFRPVTTDPKFGVEPSLQEIVMHYYVSHDIPKEKAKKLTEDYFNRWVELEKTH